MTALVLWVAFTILFAGLLACGWLLARVRRRLEAMTDELVAARRTIEEKNDQLVQEAAVRRQIEEEQGILQTRLQQAQKMEAIGTLAGGIAHDFNNILNAVIGFSELAIDQVGRVSPARKSIESVLAAGLRAAELTQQILTFSRRGPKSAVPLRVKPIVAECAKLLKSTFPSTIEIVTSFDPKCEDARIIGDHSQLHQVLMNLCTNAFHAMRESGGVLTVSLTEVEIDRPGACGAVPELPPGSYLELGVKDTGRGMEPDVLERIFEPYFTTEERGSGTGLGLSVVQGIVESVGGRIAVESQVGKGSIFRAFFPRVQASATEAPAGEKASALPGGSERILFVDDEQNIVNLQKEALSRLGYEVTTTTDSAAALRLVEKDPAAFDVIITDMTMPNLTGAALAQGVLAQRPDARIILCTGFSETVDERKAKELGFKAYLRKPVPALKMAQTVRAVLDAG